MTPPSASFTTPDSDVVDAAPWANASDDASTRAHTHTTNVTNLRLIEPLPPSAPAPTRGNSPPLELSREITVTRRYYAVTNRSSGMIRGPAEGIDGSRIQGVGRLGVWY